MVKGKMEGLLLKEQMVSRTADLFDLLLKTSHKLLGREFAFLRERGYQKEYYELYGNTTYFRNISHSNTYLKELYTINKEEIQQLSGYYQQALEQLGVNFQFIFQKPARTIEECICDIQDKILSRSLLYAWKYGDEVVRKGIVEYLDGDAGIQFDLDPNEADGKTTRKNGKIVYHINRKYRYQDDTYQTLSAALVIGHETYRDGYNQGNKFNTRQAVLADMEMAKHIFRNYGRPFIKKNPWLGFLLYFSKKAGKEKFKRFIDSVYSSDQDYWKLRLMNNWNYTQFNDIRAEVDRSGDNLWDLTERLTGNGSRWQEIGKDSSGNVVNPRLLHRGDSFSILNIVNTAYTFNSQMQQLYNSSGIVDYLENTFQSVGKTVDYQGVDFRRIDQMELLPIGNDLVIEQIKKNASALVFPAHTINAGDSLQNAWIKILTVLELANQKNLSAELTSSQLEKLRALFHESMHVAQYEEYIEEEHIDVLGTAIDAAWQILTNPVFNPVMSGIRPGLIYPYPPVPVIRPRKTHGSELDFLKRYVVEYIFSPNQGYDDSSYTFSRSIASPRDIISNPIREDIVVTTYGYPFMSKSVTLDKLADAFGYYYTSYYLNELNNRSR